MADRKILVVGHDARAAAYLGTHLGRKGFAVLFQDVADIEVTLSEFDPDLVLVRSREILPTDTVARLRTATDALILVAADHSREAVVEVLKAGADDVVANPEDLDEVVARVEAMLRRADRGVRLGAGDLTIELDAHTAWRGDHRLDLTDIEFELLAVLVRHHGLVVSKRQLLKQVWGSENYSLNLAEVHVSALRRKLEAYGPRVIETVRSHGYIIRDGHGNAVHHGADDNPGHRQLSWLSDDDLTPLD